MKATLAARLAQCALAAVAWLTPVSVDAQDVQRIAAIVNDEVVSRYDVEQRMRLVIATGRLRDTPELRRRLVEQVLRGLVDERLQLQEARRHSIRVSKRDLQHAFRFIESRNNLAEGEIEQFFRRTGVPRRALEAQLRAEIAWTKLIQRRLARQVQIADDEVDEVYSRLRANAGRSEQRVSEIFLPIDNPQQEEEVRRSALRLLQQLRQGADFAAIARQFSRGATAAQGGDVGWLQPGQLSSQLDQAISKLEVGAISEPIRAAGGFYLMRINQRRKIAPAGAGDAKLKLRQILLPVAAGAPEKAFRTQEKLAETVADTAANCDDVEEIAGKLEAGDHADLGTLALQELPEKIRNAVKDLAIGRFSKPIRGNGGVMLLMVCEREVVKGRSPDRTAIADNLAQRRLVMLAQRYLRDLRRAAVVELR
ncbi:MAG: peptidylprolyl isomerase [Alphaproteobacteria bacterium]|jgi:peptidyl-prolyl cis-trans isomerase SurA|nr:peptidylprolyl isomerase [Alphaproteobacteria bacterium]MDP6565264.1 peptidylprolyl isomerase [Alphaproteobacteria bacterium]MDP6813403.1 peptidylprolyl isomerase [Alphaproteobacteria bacterium]